MGKWQGCESSGLPATWLSIAPPTEGSTSRTLSSRCPQSLRASTWPCASTSTTTHNAGICSKVSLFQSFNVSKFRLCYDESDKPRNLETLKPRNLATLQPCILE